MTRELLHPRVPGLDGPQPIEHSHSSADEVFSRAPSPNRRLGTVAALFAALALVGPGCTNEDVQGESDDQVDNTGVFLPPAEDPFPDDTDGGDTDEGDTDGGDTDGGDTDEGETDEGETDGGETDGGETDGGETDGGHTDEGETDEGETDEGETDEGETDDAPAGIASRMQGDSPCAPGAALVTFDEANDNTDALCGMLGTWDIVRLAGGGSMDGPGYGCAIRETDDRELGHTLCKSPLSFSTGQGDGVCEGDAVLASPLTARAHAANACEALGTWYIARLAGGGSMDGPGYDCAIRETDDRALGHSLCVSYEFARVDGDSACNPGDTLITPEDARERQDELCELLGTWDIARLAGGGSMDGPGYGCGIRDYDDRALGHSLCVSK